MARIFCSDLNNSGFKTHEPAELTWAGIQPELRLEAEQAFSDGNGSNLYDRRCFSDALHFGHIAPFRAAMVSSKWELCRGIFSASFNGKSD